MRAGRHQLRRFIQQSREADLSLHERLRWYFISLAGILLSVMFTLLALSGLLSGVDKSTQSILNTYLGEYAVTVDTHYDNVAGQGLSLSKNLSKTIEQFLAEQNLAFADLSDNRYTILDLESAVFPALQNSLLMTNASGSFVVFDTTVNTTLPTAENSRSSLYLKIANVNVVNPVDPDITVYRGVTGVARTNGILLHNQWNMETDISIFPAFRAMKQAPAADLLHSYMYTASIDLASTWEKAMYLCVPVRGTDGTFYGICGFEISAIYYELAHLLSASEFERVAGFLAQKQNDILLTGTGLESGTYNGYLAGIRGRDLSIQPKNRMNLYTADGIEYIGLDRPINLYPNQSDADLAEWTVAVMIPKADYDAVARSRNLGLGAFGGLIVIISVLSSMILSKKFVRPIVEGLQMLRAGEPEARSKVPEINDLMEFLAARDAQAEREAVEKAEKLSPPEATDQRFEDFAEHIQSLSKAERKVFELYLRRYSAQQIADELFLSLNTIKTHNKRIYMKLGVASRKELLVYADRLREKGEAE
jgi:DNA-binding CsgD family transcriptional regulator